MRNVKTVVVGLFMWALANVPASIYGQTFNGIGNLPFPPSGTVGITTSICNVSGIGVLGGCSSITNVTINLNHTWTGDIALFLIAPDGTFIELSSGNGSAGNDYLNTVFTDAAGSNIITGSPPFTGLFKPEGRQNSTLTNPYPNTSPAGTFTFQNTFDGIDADGQWQLYLNDYVAGDIGFLNNWSMTFSSGGTNFTVNVGPDQSACAGQSYTLTASNTAPSPTGFAWSNGATTQTITVSNLSSNTNFTVTVTDQSGCTATDAVALTVVPLPAANPVTLAQCEVANGQATFNLTNANGAVGNGTINWYSDPNLTNAISDPAAYQSGNATVYATVTANGCTSLPSQITLVVTPSNPASYGMDIVQSTLCEMGLITVQFTLPAPGIYTYNYTLSCDGNGPSIITTTANPIFFSIDENCTLEITSITSFSTGCTTTFSPPLTDNVTIVPNPNITVDPIEICAGSTIDLADYVSSNAGAVLTFHSATPPNTNNQLSTTTVNPSVNTTFYVVSSLQGCSSQAAVPVVVQPGGIPFTATSTICQNEGPVDLDDFVSPAGLEGSWSGTGVSGESFDPSNLSGNIVATFTPVNPCYDDGTVTFTVLPNQLPLLTTTTLCASNGPFDLNTLEDPSFPDGTWSGSGVTGNVFTPDGLTGTQTLTFQSTGQCVEEASTTITLLDNPQLNAPASLDVCTGSSLNLEDVISNPSNHTLTYYNALPLVPANQFPSPLIQVIQTETIYIKMTDGNGCFSTATITLIALPSGAPLLGSATVCQNQTTFDLTALEDAIAGSGTWSGPGVINNQLNVQNQTGNVVLTFVPANTCFTEATTSVEIIVPQSPVLGSTNVCSGDGLVNLDNLADPLFPNGNWSGPGVANNAFNPVNFSGPITLTYTPTAFCTLPSSTVIDVTETQFPLLRDTILCSTFSTLNLSLLEDPAFPQGNWEGIGIANNAFPNPGTSGSYNATFVSSEACVAPAVATIIVQQIQQPDLPEIAICANQGAVLLDAYTDPDFPAGTWEGEGVFNNIFSPSGLSGNIQLLFNPSAFCAETGFTTLSILETPSADSVLVLCQSDTKTYTVQFNITGGQSGTYLVNGLASTSTFVSQPINSGTSYNFTISDANNCSTFIVNGSKNCDCITDAGTLNTQPNPIPLCDGQSFTANHNQNQTADANDAFYFILHKKATPLIGTVLATSKNGTFSFSPGFQKDSIYYITAVCGDSLGNGTVDFSDPCFSYSASQRIVFYETGVKVSGDSTFCAQDCNLVSLSLKGLPPFSLVYEVALENAPILTKSIQTNQKEGFISLCPKDYGLNEGILILKISEANDANCQVTTLDTITKWRITPPRISTINQSICTGDSLVVNGKIYSSLNPTGVDTIQADIKGKCDSIIFVKLTVLQPIITKIVTTLCEGEEVVAGGQVFDITNPNGSVILPNASQNGCDSIINVALTFEKIKSVNYSDTLCSGEFIVINGVRFDEKNPSGSERILGQNGQCDTIATIALYYNSPSQNQLLDTLCYGEKISVGQETFDEQRPSGTVILKNSATTGCDSIVIVSLSYRKFQPDTLVLTLLKGRDTILYNTLFNELSPKGLIPTGLNLPTGCPEFVFVQIQFELEQFIVSYDIIPETCPGEGDGYITIQDISGCRKYVFECNGIRKDIDAFPFTFGPLPPGKYSFTLTGDVGCIFSSQIEIKAAEAGLEMIGPVSFTAPYNAPVPLSVVWNKNPLEIVWTPGENLSCSDCPQPTFTGTNDQNFTILTVDSLGCLTSFTVEVIVQEAENDIVASNVLTLNGDGSNDFFIVQSLGNSTLESCVLFDRWGNVVFDGEKQLPGKIVTWDGSFGSQSVNPGVYVFVVTANVEGKIRTKSGNVTVLR